MAGKNVKDEMTPRAPPPNEGLQVCGLRPAVGSNLAVGTIVCPEGGSPLEIMFLYEPQRTPGFFLAQ